MRDESRKCGEADFIAFPETEEDVREVLRSASAARLKVTIQGARTGITAGSVPEGGLILNLSRMNKINEPVFDKEHGCFLTVQPGVLLTDIRKVLEDTDCFFPPDPTEASASIGGMVACNASGACSYNYGPVRSYVEALRVVLADGSGIQLQRGRHKAIKRSFSIHTDTGREISGELPEYLMPAVKNAAGYYAVDDMELVDLFTGAEGTLGVVTEIKLRLLEKPAAIWGVMAFFPAEEAAVRFVRALRGDSASDGNSERAGNPAAIEYFNHDALKLLRKMKADNKAFADIPDMPASYHTAIYFEYHGSDEQSVSDMVVNSVEQMEECGGNGDDSWIATGRKELERLKYVRHAVPEAVNLEIDIRRKSDPGLSKLGTDMAVPDSALEAVMDMYNRSLAQAGLESVMFGHIGSNHIHVNILPFNMEDYNKGKCFMSTGPVK